MLTRAMLFRIYPRLAIALVCLTGAVTGVSLLSSCATSVTRGQTVPRGFHFDYTVAHREETELVQVFDDGTRTYLQFKHYPSASLTIRDATGRTLESKRWGLYAIVAGLHTRLAVRVAGSESDISRDGAPKPARPSSPIAQAPQTSESQLRQEEGQVRDLRMQVAALELQLAAARSELARLASHLVVHFANNSAQVVLEPDTAEAMADAIRALPTITITGFTDANYADQKGASLALKRARALRDILIAHGVPREALHVAGFAARHFAADDTTASGKALNRRAEIVSQSGQSGSA